MYRGTTPTLCFTVMTTLDLSEVEETWITLRNLVYERTYSGDEVKVDPKNKRMYIDMSQEETLSFSPGKVNVQARMLMKSGKVFATKITSFVVEEILKDGVISCDSFGSGGEPGDTPGCGGDSDVDIVE